MLVVSAGVLRVGNCTLLVEHEHDSRTVLLICCLLTCFGHKVSIGVDGTTLCDDDVCGITSVGFVDRICHAVAKRTSPSTTCL